MIAPNDDPASFLTEEELSDLKKQEEKYEEALRTQGRVVVPGVRREDFPRWLAVLANRYGTAGWRVELERTGHFTITHPLLLHPAR